MPRLFALLLLGAAAAAGNAAGAQRAPVVLTGAATFGATGFAAHCTRADAGEAKVVECEQRGPYRGSAVRGSVTYTWHWHLVHGGSEPQTAHGDEDAAVVLRSPRGTLRLRLRGTKASGHSSGRWSYVSGTKAFARRRGAGTYRFETTGATDGFSAARLVLRGTLR